jgi:hypothetical protein
MCCENEEKIERLERFARGFVEVSNLNVDIDDKNNDKILGTISELRQNIDDLAIRLRKLEDIQNRPIVLFGPGQANLLAKKQKRSK